VNTGPTPYLQHVDMRFQLLLPSSEFESLAVAQVPSLMQSSHKAPLEQFGCLQDAAAVQPVEQRGSGIPTLRLGSGCCRLSFMS